MRRGADQNVSRIFLVLVIVGFLWLVLASSNDDGPEWSGVSHVDGRN